MKQKDFFMKPVKIHRIYYKSLYLNEKYKDCIITDNDMISDYHEDGNYRKCIYKLYENEGIIIGQQNKNEGICKTFFEDYDGWGTTIKPGIFILKKVIRFWKVLVDFNKVVLVND